MNIAITGMKHIYDPNIVFLTNGSDFLQDMRELRSRHHAILCAIAWTQSPDRSKRLLPTLPQLQPLLFITCQSYFASSAARADVDDLIPLLIHTCFQPINLN